MKYLYVLTVLLCSCSDVVTCRVQAIHTIGNENLNLGYSHHYKCFCESNNNKYTGKIQICVVKLLKELGE